MNDDLMYITPEKLRRRTAIKRDNDYDDYMTAADYANTANEIIRKFSSASLSTKVMFADGKEPSSPLLRVRSRSR